MLLGLPTSIADASVGVLGRGCHWPVDRKSGIVRFAFTANTTSPIGNPMARAQTHAMPLPRLPVGTIELACVPCLRQCHRLAAAWYAACGSNRPMLMLFAAESRCRPFSSESVNAAF